MIKRNLSKNDRAIVDEAIAVLDKAASGLDGFLNNSDAAREYFRVHLGGLTREHFMVAYLDSGLRLISCDVEFIGSVDDVQVQPKEILRKALTYNATHVILAHNHPSGNLEASDFDRRLTNKIKEYLYEFDIVICDHVIVGYGSDTFSFNQEGLL